MLEVGFSYLKGQNKMKTFYFLTLIFFFAANLPAQTLDTNLPQTDNMVRAVAYDAASNTIYIGGYFTKVDTTARKLIAAIDASTGTVETWNPSLSATISCVVGIAIYDTSIFVCGDKDIAKVGRSGNVIWEAPINYGPAQAIAVSSDGDTIFVGGNIMDIRSVSNSIFALSALDGSVIWSKQTDTYVRSFAVYGSTLYVGGQFTNVDGVSRNYLAALSTADGSLLSWNPGASSYVYALATEGSTLYVGGVFTSVSGSTRNHLAAFNISNGALLSWNPNASDGVNTLAVDSSTVYVGGHFYDYGVPATTIGGADRNYIAALDPSTGNATNWNPGADYDAMAIALSPANEEVYLGGAFAKIDGISRSNFAGITNPQDISLPVQATDFLATADAGSVALTWKTKSEVDNAGFNILREDPGALTFKMTASYTTDRSLCGLGTSSTGKSYNFTDDHVVSGDRYAYKIEEVSTGGAIKDLTTLSVTVSVPKTYALFQNYPNPFNPTTVISYKLSAVSNVTLRVYDVLGRAVKTLVDARESAGGHSVTFDASGLPSGVYFYRLNAGGFSQTRKLMVIK